MPPPISALPGPPFGNMLIIIMSAIEIIQQIRQLPNNDQAKVNQFFHENLELSQLSADELGELTRQMVDAKDPREVERLKQEIFRGFFGDAGPDA